MPRTSMATLALTSMLVVSSCGGSSRPSQQPTTPANPTTKTATAQQAAQSKSLTRAQLTARVNAVCKRTAARRNPLKIRSQAEFAVVIPQVAAFQRTMAAELGKLSPPAALATEWNQFVAYARTLADSATKVGEELQTNRFDANQPAYTSFARTRLQLRALAKRDGFRACAGF
jgi:C4-dicarboxylate-specific signal transduction histidine kinase